MKKDVKERVLKEVKYLSECLEIALEVQQNYVNEVKGLKKNCEKYIDNYENDVDVAVSELREKKDVELYKLNKIEIENKYAEIDEKRTMLRYCDIAMNFYEKQIETLLHNILIKFMDIAKSEYQNKRDFNELIKMTEYVYNRASEKYESTNQLVFNVYVNDYRSSLTIRTLERDGCNYDYSMFLGSKLFTYDANYNTHFDIEKLESCEMPSCKEVKCVNASELLDNIIQIEDAKTELSRKIDELKKEHDAYINSINVYGI